jgi:cardiolipin synthase
MTALLLISGGVIAALLVAFLYITFAANAEANHQDRVLNVPEIGSALDDFLRALHGAAGDAISEGNTVDIYQNGDEIFPPMLAAIQASLSNIHFSTYVYWAGVIPETFSRALSDAALRGVAVRVVLDSEGAEPMPKRLVQQMRDGGARSHGFGRCAGSTG